MADYQAATSPPEPTWCDCCTDPTGSDCKCSCDHSDLEN